MAEEATAEGVVGEDAVPAAEAADASGAVDANPAATEGAAPDGAAAPPADAAAAPADKIVKRGKVGEMLRRTSRSILDDVKRRRSQTIESLTAKDDADEKTALEEAKWKMPADFFYSEDDPQLAPKLEEGEAPKQIAKAHKFVGFDFKRYYNLVWTSEREFAYITGHVVKIVNIQTGDERMLYGRDTGGIGAIGMNDDMKYLAVAEKSTLSAGPPNVYIYTYKNFKLYRVLRKGTERGFAAVAFSPHNKGMHLAALGKFPDYLLTVWDWRNERMLLKCKAYGQDVFSVRWGQFPGMLMTCGTGHIRFWKMATTFTGLKLQGDIGKFGASELSDVVGFVELPDGKVVTGTEYGRLLLWEGVFVKVELMKGGPPDDPRQITGLPHEGSIDVVMMDKEENCVVSGGSDGYLCWWSLSEIDEAEADYDLGVLDYGITLRKRIRIPSNEALPPAHIFHVARSRDDATWLIQDIRNGSVWKYDRDTDETTRMVKGHAGKVTGTLIFPSYPGMVVSAGMDGTLRAFNMTATKGDAEVYSDNKGAIQVLPGGKMSQPTGICCMAPAPEVVDPERRTLCCGYEDGVVRAFSLCRDGFVLIQAQKPHNTMVQQLAYSPDGSFIATVGADNTVFFFEVRGLDDHMLALGFVQINCRINHVAWHESGRLLLSLEDSSIVELARPQSELVDNSETYLIQLDYRSVVPEKPEPEESDSEEEDGEEGDGGDADGEDGAEPAEKETREERRERRRREKEEEKNKGKKGDDDDEENEQEELTTEILRSVYLPPGVCDGDSDSLLFVGSGIFLGGLWSLSLADTPIVGCEEAPLDQRAPTQTMSALHTKLPAVPVTDMLISPSERFVILGFADGNCWAIPFVNMSMHVCINIADANTGSINSISLDGVESQLVVGGGDGSLSTVALHSEGILEVAGLLNKGEEYDAGEIGAQLAETMPMPVPTDADSWDLPFMEMPGLPNVAFDIKGSENYSIQDAKLKAEEDNAKAAAEQKKRRVLDKVAELRREFEDLRQKNSNVQCHQLTNSETTIDVDHIEHLNKNMEVQVKEVRRELAWEVEFHERGMQKLRDYYLGRLDFERVEVLAFSSPHRVATFRCPAMSTELQANLARLHELIFAADRQTDDEDDEAGGFGETGGHRAGDTSRDAGGGAHGESGGHGFSGDGGEGSAGGERTLSGAEQKELRRQQRQERKKQMQELEKAKPSEAFEDPLDVEAIAHAEATLGNFMLKTSDSYQVPENQRMNAEKKRRQMFLLEESMHAIKTEFNHRVLALRDFRQQVRQEVKRDLAALSEIDQQLGTDTAWVKGLLDDPPGAPKEFPERRFEITEVELKAYQNEKTGAPAEPAKSPEMEHDDDEEEEDEDDEERDEEDEDGEDGDGDEEEPEQIKTKSSKAKKHSHVEGVAASTPQPLSGRAALAARRIARLTTRTTMVSVGEKGLNKAVFDEAQARLWHDKAQLEEHIRQVIDTFNSAVASIEKEKAKLESDLKNADMKLLVLYEELLTLNALEEKDEGLLRKATNCRQEKTKIMHQIKECQDQLGEKKQEIEQWHNEEQGLQGEFTDLVGENSPFLSALLKIYKKKVKRTKRKKAGEEEEYDEDEEDEEDESEMDSDEEDDDMEEDVGPPQGCDVQIYESVIDLRERRLDMEDALAEIQKAVEELKKTHKKLLEDERNIDKVQKTTDQEIQQFQTDKQRKLNQVQIVFALRISQVQCLDSPGDGSAMEDGVQNSKLPVELQNHVVFTHEGIQRLMNRIKQLYQEKEEVKQNFKQLQRDYRSRQKEKKLAMQHIEDLNLKFQDIQMLKFGQIVDLDLIERSAPNKYVMELQDKVGEAEKEHRRRIAEWEKRIEKQKKDLTKVTADNTSLMDQIVSMGYSQMQLDAALNARIANVTVNDTEPLIELREMERERLKDLLTLQSKEIATLQAEINLFRRKGGHIYTTVTANRT